MVSTSVLATLPILCYAKVQQSFRQLPAGIDEVLEKTQTAFKEGRNMNLSWPLKDQQEEVSVNLQAGSAGELVLNSKRNLIDSKYRTMTLSFKKDTDDSWSYKLEGKYSVSNNGRLEDKNKTIESGVKRDSELPSFIDSKLKELVGKIERPDISDLISTIVNRAKDRGVYVDQESLACLFADPHYDGDLSTKLDTIENQKLYEIVEKYLPLAKGLVRNRDKLEKLVDHALKTIARVKDSGGRVADAVRLHEKR